MQGRKKILGAALGGATTLALLAVGATPAQAAVTADGDGFIETKSTTDAGGVVYTLSVDWNYKYTYQGVTRVSVNPLVVKRTDEAVIFTGSPEDAGAWPTLTSPYRST